MRRDPVTRRLLLTVSLAVFLVGQALITFGVDDALTTLSQKRRVIGYLAAAVVISVLGSVLTSLTATGVTAVLVFVLYALVVDAIIQTKRVPAEA